MPIFLQAPAHNPRGVDGNGHNRFAITVTTLDECALKPKSLAAFFDALDTRRARYGAYGPCTRHGRCSDCVTLTKRSNPYWFINPMFVRIDDVGRPWLMNRVDNGWDEFGKPITWEWLLAVESVSFKRTRDEYGEIIEVSPVQAGS